MTIGRIKAPGFAIGEKMSSAQLNQIDIDHTRSCDHTAAGDTIAGTVVVGGGLASVSLPAGAKYTIAGPGSLFKTQNGGRIVLGDGDVPQFSATRPLVRVAPCRMQQKTDFKWQVSAGISKASIIIGLVGACDITPYLIDGATLASVDIFFAVGLPHAAVPVLPSVILNAKAIATGGLTALAAGTPTGPGSGSAWYANGAIQTFNIALSSYTVNRALNTYYMAITDESGGNARTGNSYYPFRLNFTGIADMRPA